MDLDDEELYITRKEKGLIKEQTKEDDKKLIEENENHIPKIESILYYKEKGEQKWRRFGKK